LSFFCSPWCFPTKDTGTASMCSSTTVRSSASVSRDSCLPCSLWSPAATLDW
jgi:hypothetical protein